VSTSDATPTETVDSHRPSVDEVAQGTAIRETILARWAEGVDNIFFIGCGGSYFGAAPFEYLLDAKLPTHPVRRINADEFNCQRPAAVGPRTLAVVASHSGSTPETVKAITTARELGVPHVIAVSADKTKPLAAAADTSFLYHHDAASTSKALLYANLTHAILEAARVETREQAADAVAAYVGITETLADAILAKDEELRQVAETLAGSSLSFILGAGPDEDVARSLSMCYLQEMQWLDSEAFNAGEFFHGAFEVVTGDSHAVLLLMGESPARPMEERAKTFLERYSTNTVVVDSKTIDVPGLDPQYRPEISPHILNGVVDRLAKLCEGTTGHSMKIRRYMGEVEY
jgi:fructoselysine 6-phosphate deglycase